MIWILLSMLGLMSARLSCDDFRKLKMISDDLCDVLEIVSLILIFIACVCLKSNHIFLLAVTFSATCVPSLLAKWIIAQRKRFFQRHFVTILDDLILSMRAGNTLRDSLKTCASNAHQYQKWLLREIGSLLCHEKRQQNDYWCEEMKYLMQICVQADKKGHRTVEALCSLRDQCRLLENFRRRSRLMTAQLHLQARFSVIIYLILIGLMIWWRGLADIWLWVGLSAVPMTLGVLLINKRCMWKSKI